MNNKEFIAELAKRTDNSLKDTTTLMSDLTKELADQLDENPMITITGFGTFEVKKKLERVVVNPGTKQRMLIPPKITLSFKPSTSLKDKL
jgi:DNA-binding protein HU-beta